MTFTKAIKILDLLDHDKTIVVKELCDENEYYCDYMREVDRFSKYDEIGNYMKYFTDSDDKYHFYILEDDDFCSDEEIKED
jgi:hypothetical protein